mmetsp:Transcript_4081/g.8633  ORF Transcript_4081/g.8633 Transcript_4081/m.8633 type:complete len:204 (-) Transcript_4081:282-893(-)
MPRVFSSVREALNGVMSGTAAPAPTRRRLSCPTIDTPHDFGHGSGSPRVQQTQMVNDNSGGIATNGSNSGSSAGIKEEDFECNVIIRVSDNDANDREIDVSALTDDDLRRLRRDDPFMYYSIPAERRMSYQVNEQEEEYDDIETMRYSSTRARRRYSLPAEVLAEASVSRSRHRREEEPEEEPARRDSLVRRNRRFSTEAHPS